MRRRGGQHTGAARRPSAAIRAAIRAAATQQGSICSCRSPVNLKDKWRNLIKKNDAGALKIFQIFLELEFT